MNRKVCYSKLLYPLGVMALLMCGFGLALPISLSAKVQQQISSTATVRVIIERVEALDEFDSGIVKSPPDFFALVTIDGQKFERSPIIEDQAIITPNWAFSKPVALLNQANQTVIIKVEIWDSDEEPFSEDDLADLDTDGDNPLNLTINLLDCIDAKAGAIAGNFDTTKNCHESVTVQGDAGDHARITFRVIAETSKSTLIVKNEAGQPVANAEIRHYRADEQRNRYLTDGVGQVIIPCLQSGDELMALQLMHTQPAADRVRKGWHYRTFLTSLDYQVESGEAIPYVVGNDQCGTTPITLIVKSHNPLVLFNLVVSVGWGADVTFLNQLRRALISANEVLFDVTDGQFAFGDITIRNGREDWAIADLQITPSNYRRPYAIAGGITRQLPYTYTSSIGKQTVFYPGYMRIGRAWDRNGSPTAQLDNFDGFRMLVHEFAHYAFMLLDEYFYFDENNNLHSANCFGSLMFDSYATELELDLQGNPLWTDACRSTEQYLTHGESAWETLVRVYADQITPPRWTFRLPATVSKPGPVAFPFQVTAITLPVTSGPSDLANGTGLVQLTVLNVENERSYTGQTQVFTLRKNERNVLRVFEQGTVNQAGVIELVSMKANDVVIAASWDGMNVGTSRYLTGTSMRLEIDENRWRPIVTANPLQNTAKQITGVAIEALLPEPPAGQLMAAMIPLSGVVTISNAITLLPTAANRYTGIWPFSAGQSLDEAFLWIGDVSGGIDQIYEQLSRQVILPITLGGSPDLHKRSNPPRHPSSSDGYCELHVPDATWSADLPVTVLSPQSLPLLDNPQRLVSAPCYIGVPTAVMTFTQPVAFTIYYNREATQGIPHEQLKIYHWHSALQQWQLVKNNLIDASNYRISTSIRVPGFYVAMQALPTQLLLTGPAQNGVAVANRFTNGAAADLPVATALASCRNGAAFHRIDDTIERFYTYAPTYVNTLRQFQPGRTYDVLVNDECAIDLDQGQVSVSSTDRPANAAVVLGEPTRAYTISADSLPMIIYGTVKAGNQPALNGSVVTAFINGRAVATAATFGYQGETVFVLSLRPEDLAKAIEDDVVGQSIDLTFSGATNQQSTIWQPGAAKQLNLTSSSVTYRSFLPVVTR